MGEEAGGKDEAGEGGIWRWLRRNEVGYVKKCVFVVEPQLFSPWGFKQLSCTPITHTYTYVVFFSISVHPLLSSAL